MNFLVLAILHRINQLNNECAPAGLQSPLHQQLVVRSLDVVSTISTRTQLQPHGRLSHKSV